MQILTNKLLAAFVCINGLHSARALLSPPNAKEVLSFRSAKLEQRTASIRRRMTGGQSSGDSSHRATGQAVSPVEQSTGTGVSCDDEKRLAAEGVIVLDPIQNYDKETTAADQTTQPHETSNDQPLPSSQPSHESGNPQAPAKEDAACRNDSTSAAAAQTEDETVTKRSKVTEQIFPFLGFLGILSTGAGLTISSCMIRNVVEHCEANASIVNSTAASVDGGLIAAVYLCLVIGAGLLALSMTRGSPGTYRGLALILGLMSGACFAGGAHSAIDSPYGMENGGAISLFILGTVAFAVVLTYYFYDTCTNRKNAKMPVAEGAFHTVGALCLLGGFAFTGQAIAEDWSNVAGTKLLPDGLNTIPMIVSVLFLLAGFVWFSHTFIWKIFHPANEEGNRLDTSGVIWSVIVATTATGFSAAGAQRMASGSIENGAILFGITGGILVLSMIAAQIERYCLKKHPEKK